jgi:hypothetical protein
MFSIHYATVRIRTTCPIHNRRKFTYEKINARNKTSPDIAWLKYKSLADLDGCLLFPKRTKEIVNYLQLFDLILAIIFSLFSALDDYKNINTKLLRWLLFVVK